VVGSNRNDLKLLRETIESIAIERPLPTPEQQQQQGMCLDKGYDYDEGGPGDPEGIRWRNSVKEFGFTAHIRARGEEAQAIKREVGYIKSPSLGSGAGIQLDEPLPGDPYPLGEEGSQLLGLAPPLLRLYHLQAGRPTGIGSKGPIRI
jgi:hypothetical protein